MSVLNVGGYALFLALRVRIRFRVQWEVLD